MIFIIIIFYYFTFFYLSEDLYWESGAPDFRLTRETTETGILQQ